jgi:hypothetical protein
VKRRRELVVRLLDGLLVGVARDAEKLVVVTLVELCIQREDTPSRFDVEVDVLGERGFVCDVAVVRQGRPPWTAL